MRGVGRVVFAAVFTLAVCSGSPAIAAGPAEEYAVKAAFLYNFAKFVEWPPQALPAANGPFVIGVLGSDPFGPALDALADKTVKGRAVAVRRIEALHEVPGCHVLFVSSSEKDRLAGVLSAGRRASVLTVGDMDGFAGRGGVIGFVLADGKVRFEVNTEAAHQAQLTISSQLLKLAIRIEERPR